MHQAFTTGTPEHTKSGKAFGKADRPVCYVCVCDNIKPMPNSTWDMYIFPHVLRVHVIIHRRWLALTVEDDWWTQVSNCLLDIIRIALKAESEAPVPRDMRLLSCVREGSSRAVFVLDVKSLQRLCYLLICICLSLWSLKAAWDQAVQDKWPDQWETLSGSGR